mgnify:CR=1 FL=1
MVNRAILILIIVMMTGSYASPSSANCPVYGVDDIKSYADSVEMRSINETYVYNLTYETIAEFYSSFQKLLVAPDYSDAFIVFEDRVISFSKNWTYYPLRGENKEIIVDAYVDDADNDGNYDVAILTQQRNIYLIDGDSGVEKWHAYASFIDPYDKIKILDVCSQEGKEVIIWTSGGNKIFIFTSRGYPIYEAEISGADMICDIVAGDVEISNSGDEIVILYYTESGEYKLYCMNIWRQETTIFDVYVLQNYTDEPYISIDIHVSNVSVDPGFEIVIGAVRTGSQDVLVLEAYNSSGLKPKNWNSTVELGLSYGSVKIETWDTSHDGIDEIYLFSRNIIAFVNNSTTYTVWQTPSGAEVLDGTIVQDNGYTPLIIWRRSQEMNGAYMGYMDLESSQINVTEEILIGLYESLQSFMYNGDTFIVDCGGSYVAKYEESTKISERSFIVPWNIIESENVGFVVYSNSTIYLFDTHLDIMWSLEYSTPKYIQNVKLGDFHPNDGYEIAVFIYVPESYLYIDIYGMDSDLILSYDNLDMLNQNLTIVNYGEINPESESIILILKSTINETYYIATLNMETFSVTIASTCTYGFDIIELAYLYGDYIWVLSTYGLNRVYIIDEEGQVIGIREFEDVMILDIMASNIDQEIGDEVIVFTYSPSWDYYEAIICDQNILEIFSITYIESMPLIADILNTYSGNEIITVRNTGGYYYLYIYLSNGSSIVSDNIMGRTEYDSLLIWMDAIYGNIKLLATLDAYGHSLTLYSIRERQQIEIEKINIELVDETFLQYGAIYPPNNGIAKVFGLDSGDALVELWLNVNFDEESPSLSVSSENMEYIKVLDRFISPATTLLLNITASDDSMISLIEWNITYYDKYSEKIQSEVGQREYQSNSIEMNIDPNITEDTFNLTIEIKAYDVVGRNETYKREVYIDRSSPTIQSLSPERIEISGEYLHLSVYAWDDLWISKVYALVGEERIPLYPEKYTLKPGQTIIYSTQISADLLQDQENIVDIYIEDYAGKKGHITINVVNPWYTAPKISIPSYIWLVVGIAIGAVFILMIPWLKKLFRYLKEKLKGKEIVE